MSIEPSPSAPLGDAAARQNEQRFRALVASLSVGIFMADMTGACTYTNRRCQAICGFTAEQGLGFGWVDFVHEEDRTHVRAGWERSATSGVDWDAEFRFRHTNGESRWVHCSAAPIRSDEGAVIGYVGTVEDITDRRHAGAQLAYALDAEREVRARAEASRDEIESVLSSITDYLIGVDESFRVTTLNRAAAEYFETTAALPSHMIIGRSLWESFPEAFDTTFGKAYRRAMETKQADVVVDLYKPFARWFEVRIFPRPAGIAIYFRDVTERKQAEVVERRRSLQQQAIADLGARALEDGHLETLLDDAMKAVAHTIEVPNVRFLQAAGSDSVFLRAGYGWRPGYIGPTLVSTAGSQTGYALQHHVPVIVEDWNNETRFRMTPLLRDHGIRSTLSVLVLGSAGPIGVLAADDTNVRSYSEQDVHFLQAVANLVGIVVERKGFVEELERNVKQLQIVDRDRRKLMSRMVTATQEERRRIARDIHDDSIQVVAGISIRLEALRRSVSGETRDMVDDLQATTRAAIASLRTLVFDLQPISLEEEGIVATLHVQLEHLARETGFTFEIVDDLDEEPTLESRFIMYRVAREAITNVRKHARASHITIGVATEDGGYRMSIRDDGHGFDTRSARSPLTGHLGLFSMRHDVETVGGWWRIESASGHGTRVEFFVPRIGHERPEEPIATADPVRAHE